MVTRSRGVRQQTGDEEREQGSLSLPLRGVECCSSTFRDFFPVENQFSTAAIITAITVHNVNGLHDHTRGLKDGRGCETSTRMSHYQHHRIIASFPALCHRTFNRNTERIREQQAAGGRKVQQIEGALTCTAFLLATVPAGPEIR
jgi:hypothetical protein